MKCRKIEKNIYYKIQDKKIRIFFSEKSNFDWYIHNLRSTKRLLYYVGGREKWINLTIDKFMRFFLNQQCLNCFYSPLPSLQTPISVAIKLLYESVIITTINHPLFFQTKIWIKCSLPNPLLKKVNRWVDWETLFNWIKLFLLLTKSMILIVFKGVFTYFWISLDI